MNFKTIYLMVTLFLVSPLFFFSQNSLFSIEYGQKLDVKPPSNFQDKIISCAFEKKIFYLSANNYSSSKTRIINCYNTVNKELSNYILKPEKNTKALASEPVYSLHFNSSNSIILTDAFFYFFSISKNKELVFIKKIKNDKFYNQLIPLQDRVILAYINYNFHPFDSPDKHVWAKIDMVKLEIGATKKMDEENALFSHYTNSWISSFKGKIIYANTLNYTIKFFDQNFNIIDSIVTDKLSANLKYKNLFDDNTNNSKDEIIEVLQKDDSCFTRIQKVFFLNESSILVMLKLPKTKAFEYDLWRKKDATWVLDYTAKEFGFFQENQEYNLKNQPVNTLLGNMSGLQLIEGEFFAIEYPYYSPIVTKSFNRESDYDAIINESILQNKAYYGVKKVKIIK